MDNRTTIAIAVAAILGASTIAYAFGLNSVDRACPLLQDGANGALRIRCPEGEMSVSTIESTTIVWCQACVDGQ